MASSQVEIVSSEPFRCVLRDHNSRDGCRESRATQAAFQKNFKNFVRDHLNTCISISSDSGPDENTHNHHRNHNHNQVNNVDSCGWVSNGAKKNLKSLRFFNRNKDESSLVSPRRSQFLDRWAARQAQEMVSTIETETELLASPKSENFLSRPPSSTTFRRENSPAPAECSSEISNLGASASSLVQIWEKRLNQCKSNTAASASPGRSSPNACCYNENAFSLTVEEQSRGSEAGESSTSEPQANEDPFPDWESDKTGPSDQNRNSDAADSERVRVADIIKRLTATNQVQIPQSSCSDENDQEHSNSNSMTGSPDRERDRASTPELSEHRAFAQVTSSPRIRGRRAFNDLLMQMERDRHGELNNLAERGAVSEFSQRGRIQSLLRLRLLQRDVAAYDKSSQQSTSSLVNRQPQGSTIMHLREKFSTGVELGSTAQAEVADLRSPRRGTVNNIAQVDNPPSPSQLSKETRSQNVHNNENNCTKPSKNSVCQTRADGDKEEAHPSLDITFQGKCLEIHNVELQETAVTTPSVVESNANDIADEVEASDQQQYCAADTSYDETVEEDQAGDQLYAESSYDEIVEDVETSDQHYYENNYDWISHISRPRSYWEDRRKAWYMEMLDTSSDNEEIRQLIERRTVSTFLSSDFRDRMDRLMESHMGTQTHLVRSEDEEEDSRGRMDQLIAVLQEHMRATDIPEQEVAGERVEEEEEEEEEGRQGVEEEEEEKVKEEESLVSGSYHEVNDYFNQSSSPINMSSSPSLFTTWSYRYNEAGDDSDRVASTSSAQPSQSQSFYQDRRQDSSSRNHHSIEMELIYDLRGHMERLYREMSELSKSIKSCMDMQITLLQSICREAHRVEEEKSCDRAPKKGNCCICYEMKVDSLLYRCGHMCACLKCANELQCNSGKCPICRAPIVDVVRVYVDG